MMKRPQIAIFAASNLPKESRIVDDAKVFGKHLGERGYDVIYGGGSEHLMGVTARAAQEAGAHVTSVILRAYEDEVQLFGVTPVFVETEDQRYRAMVKDSVALAVLPGGPGTMSEVMRGGNDALRKGGPPLVLVRVGEGLDAISHYFNAAVKEGTLENSAAAQLPDKLRSWYVGDDICAVLQGSSSTKNQPSPYSNPAQRLKS